MRREVFRHAAVVRIAKFGAVVAIVEEVVHVNEVQISLQLGELWVGVCSFFLVALVATAVA